jgi:hypothetical protein
LAYLHNRGKFPDLKHPRNLSEYIISTCVSGEVIKYAPLADKYRVRDFVTERGLPNILTELYGHWTAMEGAVNLIDFKALPICFALKLNAGSSKNIICKDKAQLNINETKDKLNEWLKIKSFSLHEPHYDKIERCIIAEEYIQDNPTDYKFMCINGEPHHILVVSERTSDSYKLNTYNLKWGKLDLLTREKGHNDVDIQRPKNLDKMIGYAKILSEGFPFVRVDLYDTGDKVFFGEMTFTPHGGLLRYYRTKILEDMWNFSR